MPLAQRKITASDILPDSEYAARRNELRTQAIARKRRRRVEVGPFATFYFESYESMWLQVQEMLRIEKGGPSQIAGELEAYNPLIPQGSELVATLMLEIEDPVQRASVLARLGGIDECIAMEVDGEEIAGAPMESEDRTTADGKTSSIHWLRFAFTPAQIAKFKSGAGRVVVGIAHPNYGHMAVMPQDVRSELATDFD